jgi:hypothetical protein
MQQSAHIAVATAQTHPSASALIFPCWQPPFVAAAHPSMTALKPLLALAKQKRLHNWLKAATPLIRC